MLKLKISFFLNDKLAFLIADDCHKWHKNKAFLSTDWERVSKEGLHTPYYTPRGVTLVALCHSSVSKIYFTKEIIKLRDWNPYGFICKFIPQKLFEITLLLWEIQRHLEIINHATFSIKTYKQLGKSDALNLKITLRGTRVTCWDCRIANTWPFASRGRQHWMPNYTIITQKIFW